MNINQQDKRIIDGLKISYDSLNEDNNQIKEVNENYERQLNELKQDKTTKYRDWETDRKSTRLNSSHSGESRMPSSA